MTTRTKPAQGAEKTRAKALGALFGSAMQKSMDRQAQVLAEREELKKG